MHRRRSGHGTRPITSGRAPRSRRSPTISDDLRGCSRRAGGTGGSARAQRSRCRRGGVGRIPRSVEGALRERR
ncbi:MAG: hypothetical protein ACK559_00205, partial [bacterium]